MSHEVVQVIKLVKYNRKSHEMIRATCKTYRQRKIHNNEHSHKMTWFRNWITVWSSLHEPVLIYRSSHGSVFETPLYRVHNEHESGSGLGLLQRIWITSNESQTLQHASEHTNKYKYTLNILPSTPTHACTPTYTYIYGYKLTIMLTIMHTYTYIYTLIYIHTSIHTYT